MTTTVVERRQAMRGVLFCGVVTVAVAVPLTSNGLVLFLHGLALIGAGLWLPLVSRSRSWRWLWLLAVLWCGAQVFSTSLHGGEYTAVVGFGGVLTMLAVSLLVWMREVERIDPAAIVTAFAVGWIVLDVAVLGVLDTDNPWKFGLAPPALVLVLARAWRKDSSKRRVVLLLVAFVAASLWFDSRFYALLGVAVAVVLVLQGREFKRSPRRLAVIGVLAAVGLYFAYPVAASHGWLGDRAQLQQSVYDATGTNYLVDNRAEFFQGFYIVAHNPAGIGAKAQLEQSESAAAIAWLQELGVYVDSSRHGYLVDAGNTRQGYAPHSAMLDSAIQAGVLALPFWLLAVWLPVRRLIRLRGNPGETALLTAMAGASLWNALFSPMIPTTLLTLTVALAMTVNRSTSDAESQEPFLSV